MSTLQEFPASGCPQLDPSVAVEEETLPGYRPERFYPACIGEVLNDRYQIVGELGYRTTSTVWLGRHLLAGEHKTLKIQVSGLGVNQELEIYEHLNTVKSEHSGTQQLRQLNEHFNLTGPHGQHLCLVHQPLDLQLQHIFFGITDDSVFQEFVDMELNDPVPRKRLEDRTIYMSRPMAHTKGFPIIGDLGAAQHRLGKEGGNEGTIMPGCYCAPEVVLSMEWDCKVDIWNLAMIIWDLLEPYRLFRTPKTSGELAEEVHLEDMVSLLGPPSAYFVARAEEATEFFDEYVLLDKWKGTAAMTPHTLEDHEQVLVGEERKDFLGFMRRMLCWRPEDRATAGELLSDPWLWKSYNKKRRLFV